MMDTYPLPFETDKVDIFYLLTDESGAVPFDRLEMALNEAERMRANRFRYAGHRWQFVLSHALLQRCLRARTSRLHSQSRPGRNGKPELDPPFGRPALRYNLSHTSGMVAVAFAWGHEVGVDVEAINPQTRCDDLASRFFSREEASLIGDRTESSMMRFFATWTVKEAVLKAAGVGLGAPLDSFTVGLDPLMVRFKTSDLPASGWHLRQRQFPGHFMSVAVHAPQIASEPSIHFTEATLDSLLAQDPYPAGRHELVLSGAERW